MPPETEIPQPLRPLAAILASPSPFTAFPAPAAPPRPLAPAGGPPAPSPPDMAPPAAAFRGSIFSEDPDPPPLSQVQASPVPADLAAALVTGRPVIAEVIAAEVIGILQRGPGRAELLRAISLLADLLNYRPMLAFTPTKHP